MNRPLRFLAALCVGLFELLMVFAFITVLAQWASAQEQRYHPASDAAAIALHERHLRVTGTATTPKHHHSIVEMRIGDGPAGWSEMPGTGLVRLTPAALSELRGSVTSMEAPIIDSTVRLIAIPRQRFDGQLVDAIKMVTASGDTAYRYYAVSTGYMTGMLFRTPSYPPMDSTTTYFRDYRRMGSRTEYFTIVIRSPSMEATTRTLQLDYEPIDAARFKPPAGVP